MSVTSNSTADLVKAISLARSRKNDLGPLDQIIQAICRWGSKGRGYSSHVILEASNETLLAVVKKIAKGDKSEEIAPQIYRIVHNKLYDAAKRERGPKQETTLLDDPKANIDLQHPSPEQIMLEIEELEATKAAIASLEERFPRYYAVLEALSNGDDYKAVLYERFGEDMPGTPAVLKKRALDRLELLIEEYRKGQ